MSDNTSPVPCFMGLDLSTQRLKVIVINASHDVVYSDYVDFDDDLGTKFNVKEGCHQHADGVTFTSPTLMWVEALDILLDRMHRHSQSSSSLNMEDIVAVSGSGQQHGSVYFHLGALDILQNLNPEQTLSEQLADAFTVPDSPIWMDSSTKDQCKGLESAVGGAEKLAEMTGSRAYPRFTGSQIAKIAQTREADYAATGCICLVSNFLCSLLLGKYAPIDLADGSGMNLLDIHTHSWVRQAIDWCGKGLEARLGAPVPSHLPLRQISLYYSKRYSFSADCQLFPFTGDNPSTLAGLCLCPGDVAVSMGSSDTVSLWMSEARPGQRGHVFVNPVEPSAYMGMLCYRNGSRTRELVRDGRVTLNANVEEHSADVARDLWRTEFANHLEATPPGNNGNLGVYFLFEEIVPLAHCIMRMNAEDVPVDSFDKATEVRALVEGQFMGKRIHAQSLGYDHRMTKRVLATGGASVNKPLLQARVQINGV